MSRVVDDTRPYTDEEKEWLLTRANGAELIKVNERRFSHLSSKQKEALSNRVLEDEKKEQEIQSEIQKQIKEEEENSYHPEDVAAVQPLTIAQLRERLEKEGLKSSVSEKDKKDPDDPDDPFTEKEVLAYRLLDHLDKKRQILEDKGSKDQ